MLTPFVLLDTYPKGKNKQTNKSHGSLLRHYTKLPTKITYNRNVKH